MNAGTAQFFRNSEEALVEIVDVDILDVQIIDDPPAGIQKGLVHRLALLLILDERDLDPLLDPTKQIQNGVLVERFHLRMLHQNVFLKKTNRRSAQDFLSGGFVLLHHFSPCGILSNEICEPSIPIV